MIGLIHPMPATVPAEIWALYIPVSDANAGIALALRAEPIKRHVNHLFHRNFPKNRRNLAEEQHRTTDFGGPYIYGVPSSSLSTRVELYALNERKVRASS